MSTTLARRLSRLEHSVAADQIRRWATAVVTLRATMDPGHARQAADWLNRHVVGQQWGPHVASPNHVCPRCVDRFQPPALARAVWLMLIDHLTTGAPVALPPNVAAVYLNDPDAYPANPCGACGYLLPMRSQVRPDGTYRHIASYDGECPACGRDSRTDVEGSA